MPEIQKQNAFSKAMKTSTNKYIAGFAKIVCSLSNKKRLKIYRKLAALLRNRFSLMNALEMVYNGLSEDGKSPYEPLPHGVKLCKKVILFPIA